MIDKTKLYKKYKNKEAMTDEECQWLAYYESLSSRSDSDHEPGDDPLVGALVRDRNGIVIALAHRANGLEGDHAEYSILKGQLAGYDLSECTFFTTLEPCVDDVRGREGSSCSTLLCFSAVKTIHIGVLDPNPSVYSVGITKLFDSGKTIIPFCPEVRKAIEESFARKKKSNTPSAVLRLKRDVFSKFQDSALLLFLRDKYLFDHKTYAGFDANEASNEFATFLLDKRWVSFSAKQVFVDEGVQVMFYDSRYLNTSSRVVKFSIEGNSSKPIDDSLPVLMNSLNSFWEDIPGGLPFVVFKEAFVNALIHKDYSSNSSLLYLSKEKMKMVVENDAAPAISQTQLNKLPSFTASPEPGNGCLAELARLCGYCERDKRGEKTFLEYQSRVNCVVEGRHVRMELKVL